MDYYQKYVKYKTKYLMLKSQLETVPFSGGASREKSCNDRWCDKVRKRNKELSGVKSTKSYIPFNKLSSRDKSYYVDDNGAKPFKVVANNKGIVVYKNTLTDDDNDDLVSEGSGNLSRCGQDKYIDVVLKLKKFLGYWSGFDASPYEMHGNSILIKVTKYRYIFVGHAIYQFDTDEEILDYISYMGNSDVPYPVAYGSEYVYFMLNEEKIKRSDMELDATVANAGDIYGEFYGHIGSKKGKHTKYDFDDVVTIHARGT